VQTLLDLNAISSYAVSVLCNLNQAKKTEIMIFLDTALSFFLTGIKAQLDEGGGRILLGDDTSGEAVMLSPIGLQFVGFRISAGLHCRLVYMCIASDKYAIFISDLRKFRLALNLPVFDCCAS
jgi:hypothetical protein